MYNVGVSYTTISICIYIYTHISIPERHIAELHTQYGFFDEQGAQSGSTY